jgi:hypothetical protein
MERSWLAVVHLVTKIRNRLVNTYNCNSVVVNVCLVVEFNFKFRVLLLMGLNATGVEGGLVDFVVGNH